MIFYSIYIFFPVKVSSKTHFKFIGEIKGKLIIKVL